MSAFRARYWLFRMTPFRTWVAFSVVVVSVSLVTGYRASVAARAPQYLITKFRVVTERPFEPSDSQEARIEAAFAEAGEPGTTTEIRPMFVLGLLDGAFPLIVLFGLLAGAWSFVRRRRGRKTLQSNGGAGYYSNLTSR